MPENLDLENATRPFTLSHCSKSPQVSPDTRAQQSSLLGSPESQDLCSFTQRRSHAFARATIPLRVDSIEGLFGCRCPRARLDLLIHVSRQSPTDQLLILEVL